MESSAPERWPRRSSARRAIVTAGRRRRRRSPGTRMGLEAAQPHGSRRPEHREVAPHAPIRGAQQQAAHEGAGLHRAARKSLRDANQILRVCTTAAATRHHTKARHTHGVAADSAVADPGRRLSAGHSGAMLSAMVDAPPGAYAVPMSRMLHHRHAPNKHSGARVICRGPGSARAIQDRVRCQLPGKPAWARTGASTCRGG